MLASNYSISDLERKLYNSGSANRWPLPIIAYLIWKGSYNYNCIISNFISIIAYLIWKERYNKIIKLVITNIFNFYRNLL